ncbi:hypothetical protein [Streptomyces sp. NEAU-sy36]|uniref:hypothetical protein n=1 Tax=Streptomyces sp. NEAU-sy36 TaxID=2751189 RepID=UPI00214BBC69|nr:hypothetical protein [Streptomyces sp. NEAU-sy36]
MVQRLLCKPGAYAQFGMDGGLVVYPASSTHYVGGASGRAYTEAVTGYSAAYQPQGETARTTPPR